jgi:hypothetical protein
MRAACLLACLLSARGQPPVPSCPPVPPNPLEGVVAAARAYAAAGPKVDSGLRKADYLTTIFGIVSFFVPFQNANGSIIDPGAGVEIEYATPTFAHAAATLVAAGGHDSLLGPAAAALDSSLAQLAAGVCATKSCDFFALPVMQAFALLSPRVTPARVAAWTEALKAIHESTWEYTGQNWILTSAAGEYDRIVLRGLAAGSNLNWTWWESQIGGLVTRGFWTGEGIFNDNTGMPKVSPMAYDAFGSTYVAFLLAQGYNSTGVFAPYLAPMMERGVWTHATYQSPLGEQPVGGRSNQHQFAEATLCAVAELYAGRAAAAGDAAGACMLQRAARLYHSSVRRWRRPDAAIQILKNFFLDFKLRFGFMSYSYFSNYNLLVASWLSLAYSSASPDDAIPECAAPADVGGLAFALESPTMRKVFANVGGTYVEIMTGADPEYDSSGFNRFHFDACASPAAPTPCRLLGLLGPSQAPGISGNTAVSAASGATGDSLAMGAVWTLAGDPPGTRRSLSNNTLQTVLAAVVSASPGNSPAAGVQFSVQYILWSQGVLVTEAYTMPPAGGSVSVTATLSAPGAPALHALLAAAARARDGATVFYSPPADAALAAAIVAGFDALAAAAPPPAAPPAFATMGVSFGAFAFDGRTNYSIAPPGSWAPNAVLVQAPADAGATDGALAFRVVEPPGHALNWTMATEDLLPSRNGLIVPVYAELAVQSQAPQLSYSLQVVPWQAALQ